MSIFYRAVTNPFEKEWNVISIPASGQMFSDVTMEMFSPLIEIPTFFQNLAIQTLSHPVERQIVQKSILNVGRMREKKLLQLERSFAVAWAVMKEKIHELSPSERQHIRSLFPARETAEDAEDPPLEVAKMLASAQVPQSIYEAGQQCIQIRDAYKKLLLESYQDAHPQPAVVHRAYLTPYFSSMQHLTEDDDSFWNAVIDLIPPSPAAFISASFFSSGL